MIVLVWPPSLHLFPLKNMCFGCFLRVNTYFFIYRNLSFFSISHMLYIFPYSLNIWEKKFTLPHSIYKIASFICKFCWSWPVMRQLWPQNIIYYKSFFEKFNILFSHTNEVYNFEFSYNFLCGYVALSLNSPNFKIEHSEIVRLSFTCSSIL